MSNAYQPFLISEFKTGINTYLQPWQRPIDSFEPLTNAYVNRGTVNKRAGYSQFGNQFADQNPVMGIMRYINEADGSYTLVVGSTQNLYSYNPGSNTFTLLSAIGGANSIFWQGTATSTISVPSFWENLTPSSITITATYPTGGPDTIMDDGSGNLGSAGIFDIGGMVDYTTGALSIVFTGTTDNVSLSITATTTGGYFSGNITQFFNYTNWQNAPGGSSYLYMTNNTDPITLFDGTHLSRPIFYTTSALTEYVATTLDLKLYKNRLLIIRPILSTSAIPENQTIYWSALNNPTNLQVDVAGNGGFSAAPTGDIALSTEYLRDILVSFFTNSTWIFRFTGNNTDPFRWDKLNDTKSTNSPFGSLEFDQRVTSVGATGLIACDGVNVQRYDIPIIDYYETQIQEAYYSQVFSTRYDNLDQGWMLYVSNTNTFPLVGSVAPGSDQALIYNFIENSFATYTFSIPLTCMGTFYKIAGATWASLVQTWEDTPDTWNSYSSQKTAPILLAGDTTGNVWYMDDQSQVTDNGTPIVPDIVTTRWNPIMQLGQKVQFGYIDIYYLKSSVDPNNPIQVTLNFFVDNSENIAGTRTLTLDGPTNSEYAFKRIYINLVGEFIQMEIDPNVDAFLQFVGFIIWARPAGRLTP